MLHWWTTQPDKMDWDKGFEYLQSCPWEDYLDGYLNEFDPVDGDTEAPDAETINAVRATATAALQEAKRVWEGDYRRDADVCVMGPVTVLITGGMSWGDSPTGAFSEWEYMPYAALELVGFFQ